jgi:hypothetical protein
MGPQGKAPKVRQEGCDGDSEDKPEMSGEKSMNGRVESLLAKQITVEFLLKVTVQEGGGRCCK